MACKKGQFDVVKMTNLTAFSINVNAQHVNGITPFDLYGYQVLQSKKLLNELDENQKAKGDRMLSIGDGDKL